MTRDEFDSWAPLEAEETLAATYEPEPDTAPDLLGILLSGVFAAELEELVGDAPDTVPAPPWWEEN